MLRSIFLLLILNCEYSLAISPDCYVNKAVEQELRSYILYSHRNLGNDLIEGKGLFMDTLTGYFSNDAMELPALSKLRQILRQNQDTSLFANSILALYEKAKTEKIEICKSLKVYAS